MVRKNKNSQEPREADARIVPVEIARSVYSGDISPEVAVNTFQNTDQLFPSRIVARGPSTRPLQGSDVGLGEVPIHSKGAEYDLAAYVALNRVAGLMILKDSKTVLERYNFGNSDRNRWMSMSVAKSISSTLVGAAIMDGFIHSVDDPVTGYLPELSGSGYDQASIKHILQMTSGVRWDDSPTNAASERRRMLDLQIAQEPGTIMQYLAGLPSVATPGTKWNYSTGETHVVGALLRAATGRPVAHYLSEKIWSRVGMESDATWWLDSPGGLEVAGSGISATLRDYARFGLFVMNDGVVEGERVLPESWVTEAGSPREIGGHQIDYGYMWWPVADRSGQRGAFSARGLFGQYIYINPRERVVIVVWSARSMPLGSEVVEDNDFFNATVEALS